MKIVATVTVASQSKIWSYILVSALKAICQIFSIISIISWKERKQH